MKIYWSPIWDDYFFTTDDHTFRQDLGEKGFAWFMINDLSKLELICEVSDE